MVPVADAPLMGDDPETYMLKAAVLRRHLTYDALDCAAWFDPNAPDPFVLFGVGEPDPA